MVRRVPSKHRNKLINQPKDKDAFFRLGMLLVVGLIIACGFVYAGRQHFAALKYGYETEKLRAQRDQLADEQRRLNLKLGEAASPDRLEQAAKRLGMQPLQAAQIDPLRQAVNNAAKLEPAASKNDKPTRKEIEKKSAKPTVKLAAKSQRKPI